ncbi:MULTISPECIES: ATP-grasp domain-containing protein [unclassified Leptolyngbya]|uniref:ATP-grasp domain-containing protein n=1 Tax=unclassified Leptolyngbya TaxID=2650499 RepID=UPI0016820574|nr:ATP-grasp domain-containing protein [Leptolyngbya sp. FACHB-16]MBD1910581.1 acetate--CoA ligase family protein [Leptolyngbya sp. FACHB-8]MBD2153952.1 acetate--CoA ligase family protein [Leptolyngbya sp. FACHB-16]
MNLLEYQAKELFRQVGIPVLPSQRIDSLQDIKGLRVPYPVVLKSQVYAGERAKAGGIRFVENTIDAIAAAQIIFNLPIQDQYPDVLLAEARYQPHRELYLAVVLDQTLGRPVLLGSGEGGINVEAVMAAMQQVVVDQEFSPFYARRLTLLMGLQGQLIRVVSDVLEKMYTLFAQKDLDLLEINPLGVSVEGEVMALDGKVTVNDDALARHPELNALQLQPQNSRNPAPIDLPCGMSLVELEGSLGIVCNGAGLAMATLDMVFQASGRPAFALNLGGEASFSCSSFSLGERLTQGLAALPTEVNVKVLLLNLLSGTSSCQEVGQAIATYLRRRDRPRCPLVVRLAGAEYDSAKALLEVQGVPVFSDLDAAIAHAVDLTRPKAS